jgi:hypothetical protein
MEGGRKKGGGEGGGEIEEGEAESIWKAYPSNATNHTPNDCPVVIAMGIVCYCNLNYDYFLKTKNKKRRDNYLQLNRHGTL